MSESIVLSEKSKLTPLENKKSENWGGEAEKISTKLVSDISKCRPPSTINMCMGSGENIRAKTKIKMWEGRKLQTIAKLLPTPSTRSERETEGESGHI